VRRTLNAGVVFINVATESKIRDNTKQRLRRVMINRETKRRPNREIITVTRFIVPISTIVPIDCLSHALAFHQKVISHSFLRSPALAALERIIIEKRRHAEFYIGHSCTD